MSLQTTMPAVTDDEVISSLNQLVKEKSGIVLTDTNLSVLHNKIHSRIASLKIKDASDYIRLLQDTRSGEMNFLLNASTINFTSFMREKDHFHILTDNILPEILQKNASSKKIRIWSSACSSGEEAYTLAIVLKEALEATPGWDIKIIATDLDTDVLSSADKGIYFKKKIETFNPIRQQKWFEPVAGEPEQVRIKKDIRDIVEFRQLNLVDNWRLPEKIDLIFCRNVLIYFDTETRKKLIGRFVDQLSHHGWLVVSRTESIVGVNDSLVSYGNSVYQLK